MTDSDKKKAALIGDLRDADKAHKGALEKAKSMEALVSTIATKLATEHKVSAIKINGRIVKLAKQNGAEQREAKKVGTPVPPSVFGLSVPREMKVEDGDEVDDSAE